MSQKSLKMLKLWYPMHQRSSCNWPSTNISSSISNTWKGPLWPWLAIPEYSDALLLQVQIEPPCLMVQDLQMKSRDETLPGFNESQHNLLMNWWNKDLQQWSFAGISAGIECGVMQFSCWWTWRQVHCASSWNNTLKLHWTCRGVRSCCTRSGMVKLQLARRWIHSYRRWRDATVLQRTRTQSYRGILIWQIKLSILRCHCNLWSSHFGFCQ
jgi:hypothetical protein